MRSQCDQDVVVAVVGSHADREADREVSQQQGWRWARDNGLHYFSEVSAKTGYAVLCTFVDVSKMVY